MTGRKIMFGLLNIIIIVLSGDLARRLGLRWSGGLWDFHVFLTAISFFSLAMWLVNRLEKKLAHETFVWEQVGALPHQLPKGKWEAVALPIAMKLLREHTNGMDILYAEENRFFNSSNLDGQKARDFHKEIVRRKKRTLFLIKAFNACKISIPHDSWKKYLP